MMNLHTNKHKEEKRSIKTTLSSNARGVCLSIVRVHQSEFRPLWFSMQLQHPGLVSTSKQPKPRRSNKKTKTTREEQRTTNGTNNAFKFNFSPAMKLQHSFFASAAALLVNSPLAHSLSTAAMSTEKITK
jgi:hypothetical protein